MLSKPHYEMIARIIRELDLPKSTRAKIAADFVKKLSADNPRFNERRFLIACALI